MHVKSIFREYDIRGIWQEQFDEQYVYEMGRGFVTMLTKTQQSNDMPLVYLGHDARFSSPTIRDALTRGLIESGAHVCQLGLITSPISYFATFHNTSAAGAIMITGSHNPPNYNGFKISVGSSTIFGDEILRLKEFIEAPDLWVAGHGKSSSLDIFPHYIAHHKREFSNLGKIRVVLDCGNGAGGVIARRLYEACGVKPIMLFEEPDGSFPNHHPDPTIESNLTALKKAVKDHQAHVGIGFDGDADRIGVVDHTGRMIPGDELMVILARDILKRHPNAKIIGDVKCSDRLYTDITQHGGQPIMWKTGHSLIKQKIKTENAPFGGEMSGHIFFKDRNYGYDDALYAGLRLIEVLAQASRPSIPDILSDLPAAFNTPEIRIDTTEETKIKAVQVIQNHFANNEPDVSVNLLDGIRISYPDGWCLARSSNTQPVLVVRFEANSQNRLNSMIRLFRELLKPLKINIDDEATKN